MNPDFLMLTEKKKTFDEIRMTFDTLQSPADMKPIKMLCHYTSLPTLFSILESDSLWATATRFSNDSSEEMVFSDTSYFANTKIKMDNFLLCLSQNEDCLSQWRGYCPNGGGAVQLDLMSPRQYSVLYANYDTTNQYKLVENAPFRVLYVPRSQTLHEEIMRKIQEKDAASDTPLKMHNLLPYFKNAAFHEEGEWRLLFENTTNSFSPCIRFRTLRDGVKVPYLVIKCGQVSDDRFQCVFNPTQYDSDKKLQEEKELHGQINIPQGNDQETVYYQMKEIIKKHKTDSKKPWNKYPRIVCEGHLPVQRIILAPTYNRERLKEEVQRFCSSIYWLQDVEVVCSEIPYIPPSE